MEQQDSKGGVPGDNNAGATLRGGPIVLGIAAVALAGAVIYAATRSTGAAAPDATPSASAAASDADTALAALRSKAESDPKDAAAWGRLGSAAFQLGKFDEAVTAYEKATTIGTAPAEYWSALGEARVMASKQDPMPAAAVQAFEKAVALDPKDPRSRYFLAVKRDLSGDHKGAIDDWLALLKDTPPGAPWEADLRRTIEQVGRINNIAVADRLAAIKPANHPMPGIAQMTGEAAPAGPTAEQIQAGAALPPAQQSAMVQSMVAGLEDKLRANPANIDGWVMLMRSRMTLGQPGRAATARNAAIKANPGARARIEQEAAALGVPTG